MASSLLPTSLNVVLSKVRPNPLCSLSTCPSPHPPPNSPISPLSFSWAACTHVSCFHTASLALNTTLHRSVHCCHVPFFSLPGSSVYGDSPGKNTGVSSHSVLQGIFLMQGSNLGLSHCRQLLYCLSHQGSPCLGKHFVCWLLLLFILQSLVPAASVNLPRSVFHLVPQFSPWFIVF